MRLPCRPTWTTSSHSTPVQCARCLPPRGQPLLVILDNVWSLEGIRWLRAALPENAHLVITTRLETVMIGLGGGEYVLGLLTPDEARALIALRLNWPELPADHYDWADALAVGVGYHTLALDVAIRRLRLDARSPGAPRWREQVNRLLRPYSERAGV
jgi:hypothetical protein